MNSNTIKINYQLNHPTAGNYKLQFVFSWNNGIST